MPPPDALPARQLPRALWEAGVRPDVVQALGSMLVVWDAYADDYVSWRPEISMQHCWPVLSWARGQSWDTQLDWYAAHTQGAVRLVRQGQSIVHTYRNATEAAECEAICRAVLRAAQGGTP